jgi:hypothetical protein
MKASSSQRPSAPPALQVAAAGHRHRLHREVRQVGDDQVETAAGHRQPHVAAMELALSWPDRAAAGRRLDGVRSMSTPQTDAAPSAPSAASTTPLPEPISSTWRRAACGIDLQRPGSARRVLAGTQRRDDGAGTASDPSFMLPPVV